MEDIELCACGKPLHYAAPENLKYTERMIELMGPNMLITQASTGRTWVVPRHYIALHGLVGNQLEETAKKYGFAEVQ